METTRLPADQCPVCHHRLDSHTDPTGSEAKPSADDVSMCAYCFSYLRYGEGLKLEHMPDIEILDLSDNVRIELTRARRHFIDAAERRGKS